MAQRKTRRKSADVSIAVLTFPWVPLARAQASSSTTDSSAPSSTLSTSAIGSPVSSSSQAIRTTESTPFTASVSSTASPTIPDIVASSNPTGSAPPKSSKEIKQDDQDNGLVNSYFAILAILVLFIGLGMWYIHQRKQEAKERQSAEATAALTRDLDALVLRERRSARTTGTAGAAGNGQSGLGRYWGHWRSWSDSFARREEGLNERGEAPPVYSPRSIPEESQAEQRVDLEAGRQEWGPDDGRGLRIPLRTLSREEVPGLKPPEYTETVRSLSPESEDGMPGSATVPPSPVHIPSPRDGNGAMSRE